MKKQRMKWALMVQLFFFLQSFLFAQNWKPVATCTSCLSNYRANEPISENSYSNLCLDTASSYSTLVTLYIDSVESIGNDSMYYFNKNNYFKNSYLYLGQAHFLGKKMLQKENGVYHFYHNDTLVIHTKAGLNATWVYNSNQQDTAKVIDIKQDSVLGQLDSIKTIILTSGDSIVLSKSYGVVSFSDTSNLIYNLVGIENTVDPRGLILPNERTISASAFSIGDIVVYQESNVYSTSVDEQIFTKNKIISKGIAGDSVYFTQLLVNYITGDTTLSNGYRILDLSVPRYLDSVNGSWNGYQMNIVHENENGHLYKESMSLIITPTGNLGEYSYYSPPGLSSFSMYASSLGKVTYSDLGPGYNYNKNLKGYTNEGRVVGDTTIPEIELVAINKLNLREKNSINIYPQPANDYIIIDLKTNSQHSVYIDVNIFDLQGLMVKRQRHIYSEQLVQNLSDLSVGVYFLQLWGENGIIGSQKILKNSISSQ